MRFSPSIRPGRRWTVGPGIDGEKRIGGTGIDGQKRIVGTGIDGEKRIVGWWGRLRG